MMLEIFIYNCMIPLKLYFFDAGEGFLVFLLIAYVINITFRVSW